MPLRGKPFAHQQATAEPRGTESRSRPFAHHQEPSNPPRGGRPFAHHPPEREPGLGDSRGRPFSHSGGTAVDEDEPERHHFNSSLCAKVPARGGQSVAQRPLELSDVPESALRPSSRSGTSGLNRTSRTSRKTAPFAHHEDTGPGPALASPAKKGGRVGIAEAARAGAAALDAALRKVGTAGINRPDETVIRATPLMGALDQCPTQEVIGVIELLLDHGADVNATDVEGNTPLIHSVERKLNREAGENEKDLDNCKVEWVKILLDRGADPMKKNCGNFEQPPMNALETSENLRGRNRMGDAMRTVMRLRKLEKSLPRWGPGEPIPEVPKKVLDELEDTADPNSSKSTAVMEAYRQAVGVLRTNEGGLHLEFPKGDSEFVPASTHKQLAPLRTALECCDAILRKYGRLPPVLSPLVFEGLLPLQVGIYEQYTKRYSSPESQKELAKFVASKNRRFLKGYNWAFNELIKGPEADDLQAVVALTEAFPSGKGTLKPVQIRGTLEEVMVDAVRMQRQVILLAASIAEQANATHLVVHKAGGGHAAPSAKRLFRSHEKVCLGTGPEALLDVARGGVNCPTMKSVCKALQCFLDEAKQGRLVLLRIKMRFHLPSDGGWRDALVNFRFTDDESQHVCELQVMHKRMMTIRADMGAHKDYAQIRGAAEILELHGVNWVDVAAQAGEAGSEEDESDSGPPGIQHGGKQASRGDFNSTGGTVDLGSSAQLAARVAELEAELHERDAYIAELESQLQAVREGPSAAIMAKFKRYDRNGDGGIGRLELRAMMHTLDSTLTDDEISAVFDTIDRDGSGIIDYQEFVRWVCRIGSPEA